MYKLKAISYNLWIWFAAITLLSSAWFIEYILKVPPCELCLWQRWPYYFIILSVPVMYILKFSVYLQSIIIFLICLVSLSLGVFHSGVEQHLWDGLNSCGGAKVDYDPSDLITAMDSVSLPSCENIYYRVFGLSLANWNVIFSGLAAGILIKLVFLRTTPHHPSR